MSDDDRDIDIESDVSATKQWQIRIVYAISKLLISMPIEHMISFIPILG